MSEYTVKEFAALERVTTRTVTRWIEKGAIEVRRTPTGRIRIPDNRAEVIIIRTSADNQGQSAN